MRVAANALACTLIGAACVYGAAWFATGALHPDGTGLDVLGAGVCMAGIAAAGALAVGRRR